jgi:hypothetical protein
VRRRCGGRRRRWSGGIVVATVGVVVAAVVITTISIAAIASARVVLRLHVALAAHSNNDCIACLAVHRAGAISLHPIIFSGFPFNLVVALGEISESLHSRSVGSHFVGTSFPCGRDGIDELFLLGGAAVHLMSIGRRLITAAEEGFGGIALFVRIQRHVDGGRKRRTQLLGGVSLCYDNDEEEGEDHSHDDATRGWTHLDGRVAAKRDSTHMTILAKKWNEYGMSF